MNWSNYYDVSVNKYKLRVEYHYDFGKTKTGLNEKILMVNFNVILDIG